MKFLIIVKYTEIKKPALVFIEADSKLEAIDTVYSNGAKPLATIFESDFRKYASNQERYFNAFYDILHHACNGNKDMLLECILAVDNFFLEV